MIVARGLGVTVASGTSLYRITSRGFLTTPPTHSIVVNGAGSKTGSTGARYNYPGALSVYLAEDVDTCLAERMFYFHRTMLNAIDTVHRSSPPVTPPFSQTFVLWDIALTKPIGNVIDLTMHGSGASVFPCMTMNPSQDYDHLKDRRAHIEAAGYRGIRAPSARSTKGGAMVVLFDDQRTNLSGITPYFVDFRLIKPSGGVFANPMHDSLDYQAGEVLVSSPTMSPLPGSLSKYSVWTKIDFNH
jgi:RES domain-containing protein